MKDKLEVGMYVRTKEGIIGKLMGYSASNADKFAIWTANKGDIQITPVIDKNTIFKASYNIIDLIEVGDVITFKNDKDVYRVSCIPNEKSACDCFYLVFNCIEECGLEDIRVSIEEMQNTLEVIVTKEQFESMSYHI